MYDKEDFYAVSAIRSLSIAQIERANSGHPGIAMGAAPMAYSLWNRFLITNPKDPAWINRDRFILSAGHGSALLYSLLHLSSFDLSIDDLKNFRKCGSKTPGHPERTDTPGVEVTTGPLGQGIANAVGMAMAEKHLASLYNKPEFPLIDHYTYVICGDGDLMEGVSYESMSLAGHLNLGKLIILHDSNDICLDGNLSSSFSENIELRVKAQGFEYIRVDDGEDLEAISLAIEKAKKQINKPSFIEIKTIIGRGSKNQGTNKVHGAPLGKVDAEFAMKSYGWRNEEFCIPQEIYDSFNNGILKRGQEAYKKWQEMLKDYKAYFPDNYQSFINAINREIDPKLFDEVKRYSTDDKAIATRQSSGEILQDITKNLDSLWGGSADLFSSNKTEIKSSVSFKEDPRGRNIWYGVREFAMAAIGNGIVAHGGSFHYVSTFFVFSDYIKPALRLSALSKIPLIYVLTHDSVAVGEDGPTHQPIEQLAMLRSIPNTIVLRPADANEVRLAWKFALESKESPVVLVLSRQDLANLNNTNNLDSINRGAYIIDDSDKEISDGIFIATGSEVDLAIKAKDRLKDEGLDIRVVSMPSMELFRLQDEKYKEEILPKNVKARMTIEMGSSFGWNEFSLDEGINLSIDRFGASGNGADVSKMLGFTVDNIVNLFKSKFIK